MKYLLLVVAFFLVAGSVQAQPRRPVLSAVFGQRSCCPNPPQPGVLPVLPPSGPDPALLALIASQNGQILQGQGEILGILRSRLGDRFSGDRLGDFRDRFGGLRDRFGGLGGVGGVGGPGGIPPVYLLPQPPPVTILPQNPQINVIPPTPPAVVITPEGGGVVAPVEGGIVPAGQTRIQQPPAGFMRVTRVINGRTVYVLQRR